MFQHKVIEIFNKSSKNRIIDYFWKNKTLNSFSILGGNPKINVSEVEGYRTDSLAELEALLFLADEPLLTKKIATVLGCKSSSEARRLLKELQKKYIIENNSFHIEEVAGGFQLLSKAEFHPWLARVYARNVEVQVSSAMKETLAIAAYRQPITRADIEQIRGVNSSEVIRSLVEKNLLRIVGRDVTLGRPVLYGTTRKFLQICGLKSLKELPRTNELGTPGPIVDEDSSSVEL
jgi:segregation and condensation protein B